MKTVFSIFRGDVYSIAKRLFATAVAIAIAILPALYAWVNIYANGNPYGNTGGIKIAVASNDTGIDLDDGEHVNSAENIIENNLKNSTSIGWQFPDTAEEAIAGVESGEYYAAIIFEDDFTYHMYQFDYALTNEDAPVTFYRNDKKNAVASKITDTAASTLLESINTEYLRTLFELAFGEANALADDLNSVDMVDAIIQRLTDMRDNLDTYEQVVGTFVSNSGKLISSMNNAEKNIKNGVANGKSKLNQAESNLQDAREQVEELRESFNTVSDEITKAAENLRENVDSLINANPDAQTQLREDTKERLDSLITRLQSLKEVVDSAGDTPGSQAAATTIDSMLAQAEAARAALDDLPNKSETIKNAMDRLVDLSKSNLKDNLNSLVDAMKVVVENLTPLANNILDTVESVGPIIGASKETVSSLDNTMRQLQIVLQSSSESLTSLLNRLNDSDIDEKIKLLTNFLGGDPDMYAEFLSSLVDVEIEEVYPVVSYGAAMAPFYSTLAIWVGGVILVSILKTHINRNKFPDATESQAFFGRFLLFFMLNQIQAAVIVLGDIYLLGCAPKHPIAFWFAASVAGFVFTLLIYSLTRTFGDVGKAVVVVVMVLQIAGSSGSYPIEILPEIFSKIYRFFPFPYAINAMREALCGMYKYDYWIYLGELLLFALAGLAIGLLARRSTIGINEFVSEKIEETEVL